jgi:hypothetical protein
VKSNPCRFVVAVPSDSAGNIKELMSGPLCEKQDWESSERKMKRDAHTAESLYQAVPLEAIIDIISSGSLSITCILGLQAFFRENTIGRTSRCSGSIPSSYIGNSEFDSFSRELNISADSFVAVQSF